LVRWIPPIHGICLNVDGASKGNPGPSGGGGCFRNSSSDILLAFAFNYGFGTSLQAEVRALHDGLHMAEEFVNSINSKSALGWQCHRWWHAALIAFHKQASNIVHVFGEANQVADALASIGCQEPMNRIFTSFSMLPHVVKGPAVLDKTGLPNVRFV
ncbi:hypothetical protein Taro_034415, partial [Colocasia esculenta]|nr:hypothetical protein [Colocasia esculenta]